MITNLTSILSKAATGGFAIGSFNTINLEFTDAIIRASRVCGAPVIISLAESHFNYVTPEVMIPAILAMRQPGDPDLVIHLDHALSIETIRRGIAAGCTSVMFDGSRLSFDENVRITSGMVELTTCDALAVAIGNVHGQYQGKPKLDFDRLKRIRDITPVPLVLHGGSGISGTDFRRAIDLGISKINIFTQLSQSAFEVLKSGLTDADVRYNAFPDLMRSIRVEVEKTVEHHIRIFGNGKF